MNKQGKNGNPFGGIEWTHFFGALSGFTANPVRGCEHECRWRMGGGEVICYAKAQKERLSGPGSFEKISWHPEVLEEVRKHRQPAGIFIDSMSDLFGQGVKEEWIDQVIRCIKDCPQHVFFSLTKNPGRFNKYILGLAFPWPQNWLCGISAPPTWMFGKELSPAQQSAWLRRGLEFLRGSPAQKRWVSLEPLSFDVGQILEDAQCRLDWAVIGAGSDGARTFQPDAAHFTRAMAVLDRLGVPVFFKGNLDKNFVSECGFTWRQEFPVMPVMSQEFLTTEPNPGLAMTNKQNER